MLERARQYVVQLTVLSSDVSRSAWRGFELSDFMDPFTNTTMTHTDTRRNNVAPIAERMTVSVRVHLLSSDDPAIHAW
eukprot:m.57993 g.57993  ORF g.57993 m.57993 type:complete len:78 (+) comp11146_c0_seq1:264-497(+)